MNGQNTSTSDQATTFLTSDDIIKILKGCSDAGVQNFSYQGLEVAFKSDNLTFNSFSHDNGTRSVPDFVPDQEGILDRDEELTNKLLSDPLAYEELVEIE